MARPEAPPTLSLFAPFTFTPQWWSLAPARRREALGSAVERLGAALPAAHLYQVYPTRGEHDLLVWSAAEVADEAAPGSFFARFARAVAPLRRHATPGSTLWGTTRPSPYTRRGSSRAIDPLAGERLPYLVVYPFVKTAEWYREEAEARQRMMNEHIRIGRGYPEVQQLLLYSFGLQDQEFVVVYEMEDLGRFSELVRELRGSEARPHTARDTPIVTGLRRRPGELLDLWG